MIYQIYKDGEIIVETDNLEFARSYRARDPECAVRDARTGEHILLDGEVPEPPAKKGAGR